MEIIKEQLRLLLSALLILIYGSSLAKDGGGEYFISGIVRDSATSEPMVGAIIKISDSYLWAVSDRDGRFIINHVDEPRFDLSISYLGYVTQIIPYNAINTKPLNIRMVESSLAIDQVVVMAESTNEDINTSYSIGREALNQIQMNDISAIESLLPGGRSANPDLTSEQTVTLRGGDSDNGNAAFGTAVEVDGVRIGNNSSFSSLSGSGLRSIAVDNIESIEVITGVPSVEYGDIGSGIVKVKTMRGATPLNVNLSINPKTKQVSASKGISLNSGVLNVSGEWARAVNSIVSPYDSYSRRGASFIYSNTFNGNIRFESGVTFNIGGSNSEDDPDAYSGEYTIGRDNTVRFNSSVDWLVNREWITNLHMEFSTNYQDKTTHSHLWYSYASQQPAVHSTEEGYFVADRLDYNFFADSYDESKMVDMSGALKYELNHNIGSLRSRYKMGVQWKMSGNVGRGEYYELASTEPNGFRERDYRDYPFMHNLSFYAEERLTIPIGGASLTLIPGVRIEQIFIDGATYKNTTSFSPRFNGSLKINDKLTIRGGWGITEKLPSYYVLFPEQNYRDFQSFGASYNNNESFYSYFTKPYALEDNAELKWQRNHNAELGVDINFAGTKISLTAFHNKTVGAYQYSSYYSPFSYNTYVVPSDYTMPSNPDIKVDASTGEIYIRDLDAASSSWTAMDLNATNSTFISTSYADNGADIVRRGVEMVLDFPEIKVIKTRFRFDAAYTNVDWIDNSLSYYYQSGKTDDYIGIYATGSSSSTWLYNGYTSHGLNANVTAVTHIPKARLVISCRVEMTLLNRWQYRSEYNGTEYAFNSDSSGNPTSGSIYDGDSYTTIYPVKYMDSNGVIHDFTADMIDDPQFASLIRTSSNTYTFNSGGYDPYVFANLSITKEIGNHVSLSFYANNFTFARKAVTSYSTGTSAVFIPNIYYGLTCRVKF